VLLIFAGNQFPKVATVLMSYIDWQLQQFEIKRGTKMVNFKDVKKRK
jgi:hypothetical protein